MRMIYLVLALAVAGGLTFYVSTVLNKQPVVVEAPNANPITAAATQTQVLTAIKTLPVGHLIAVGDLEFKPWPQDAVREGFITNADNVKVEELAGTVVRLEITTGEPVSRNKVIAPGERGFLAAVLKPGMKAISIPVSSQTAVAHLLVPGDRVDVMLTQTLVKPALPGSEGQQQQNTNEQVTETIIRNARVLATGQALSHVKPDENSGGAAQPTTYDTVTLELTPKLAELLTLANEMGKLSVALNPLTVQADPNSQPQAAVIADKWPFGVEGLTGTGDQTAYSMTKEGEASPARSKVTEGAQGGSIAVFRGKERSNSAVDSTNETEGEGNAAE